MKVKRFEVKKGEERTIQAPFVRVSMANVGCGLRHCNCLPNNFITISDGTIGLSVELSKEDVAELKKGFATIEGR